MTLLAISLLSPATAAAEDSEAPISACDRFSELAHEYYRSRRSDDGPRTIAVAKLRVYSASNALSELRITKGLPRGSAIPVADRYIGKTGRRSPAVGRRWSGSDHVMFLIPPAMAGEHLGQRRAGEEETQGLRDLPAFIAVPSETFYEGRCRRGAGPILISSMDSVVDQGIDHFVLPEADLRTLVSSLFLDPKSNDLDALADHYGEQFVDLSRWRGWIDVKVQGRRRTVFHRLLRSRWGSTAMLPGTGESDLPYTAVTTEALTRELKRVETGWKDQLSQFKSGLDTLVARVDGLEAEVGKPDLDVDGFIRESAAISSALSDSRTATRSAREQMKGSENLFMTAVEIDFLTDVMIRAADSLGARLNALTVRYNDLALKDPFDEVSFMNPGDVDVGGVVVKPLPIQESALSIGAYGAGLPSTRRGFLQPGATPGTFTVNLRSLVDMERAYESMRSEAYRQAYAAQSCSRRIRSINDDSPGSRVGDRYERPMDVELQIRTCVTFDYPSVCGKFPNYKKCTKTKTVITDLYRTTGTGHVWFRAQPSREDLRLSYGYRLCVHGFICTADEEQLPSLRSALSNRPEVADWIAKNGVQFRHGDIRKSRRNGKVFLAVQLQTADLPAEKAFVILNALRTPT